MKNLFVLFFIALLSSCQLFTSSDATSKEDKIFSLLDSSKTQVLFQNNIQEGLNTNVLMYEYFYNGGGVAAGDLNGDGKDDLYFTSNMENNHLYLNSGGMKFKEVAAIAGVTGRQGPWKTGVSFVDINADHKLDIYLCYSGNLPPDKKRNQFFINQGNDSNGIPIFKDQAAELGLDSPANSTHAVFFDYDKDQDLDMILVNHNPKSLPVLDESSTANMISKEDLNSGIQFFQNEGVNKKFTNQTKALGIQSSALSYGLAVGISDVNQDGWLDFYVSNDYTIPDYLYINQKGKSFKNTISSSIGHFSHFSMGNDIADVNNDLLPDIFTLDMLPEDNLRQKLLMAPDNFEKFDFNLKVGWGHQYMRNMLQLNEGVDAKNGEVHFAESGQLAGISNTDWSWSALFADYDNDGWKDLFVSNGYLRDYTNQDFLKYMSDYVQNNQSAIQRENVLELVQKMPSSNLTNYIFRNQQNAQFSNVTKDWGLDFHSNSNGSTYADLDNDGDLDLVVNNINRAAFIFENQSEKIKKNAFLQIQFEGEKGNSNGLGAKVKVYQNAGNQYFEQNMYRGFQSSISPKLHVGLGQSKKVDSVQIIWNSGKSQIIKNVQVNTLLKVKESDAKLTQASVNSQSEAYFKAQADLMKVDNPVIYNDFKRQTQLIHPQSYYGPSMSKADVNQDGLEDVFIGGTSFSSSRLLLQNKQASFVPSKFPETNREITSSLFIDVDNDHDVDLYLASGGYDLLEPNDPKLLDQLYLNDGKGNFSVSLSLPSIAGSKSCVKQIDLNQDKLPDLFVGSRFIPGSYPLSPKNYILQNMGGGKFKDVSAQYPEISEIGMVSDAAFQDINGDKMAELILVGDFSAVQVFQFKTGKAENVSQQFFDSPLKGFWNKILIQDLNNDGKQEIIISNLGKNVPWKVTKEEPMEMYVKDFDNNGIIDPILTSYVKHEKVPFLTRDELLDQVSMMRNRFTDYQSFAEAKLNDVFTEDELKEAKILEVNELETVMLTQNKSGKFEKVTLPVKVQNSAIFTINTLDFNHDGHVDILLCGNINHAKLRVGKMDANYGLLLEGDGKLNFKVVPQAKAGLWLKGDVRSVLNVGKNWLIGRNKSEVLQFELK
ncbi:MAG: VCBS repeat-containing protein [Aquirufa sp.]